MAGVAGDATRVIGRHYLGKSLRLGAVGFVTTGTYDGGVQFGRSNGRRIVSVFRLGSVAGFARNDDVLALLFLIDDVGVAGLTGIVAGEGNRPARDLGDRSTAIVAVLPKAAWDDGSTQDDERDQRNGHDDDEPDEVLCVLEHVRFPRA